MDNKLNNLDQFLKDTYEAYEAPYDPSHWESIEKELDILAPSPIRYFSSITTGLVAASLVFMTMLLFVSEASQKFDKAETIITETPTGSGSDVNAITERSGSHAELDTAIENDSAPESELDKNTDEADSEPIVITEINKDEAKSAVHKKQLVVTSNDAPVKSTGKPYTASESSERSIRTGCTGLTIDFEASQEYGRDAKYLWNFGDGFFSNEASPSHTFNKPGTFDVSLSVTSYTTGQITSNVVQAMIDVVEAPVANIDINLGENKSITLKNKSFRADEVEWILDGKSLGYSPEISLNIADNTRYDVQLSAISAGGCTDTLQKEIYIADADVNLPKQISISQNETLTPSNYSGNGKMIQFKLIDATGITKFSTSANQTWTGESLDGQPVAPGNYQWLMAIEKAEQIIISKGEIKIF
jgi:PKD repeat protein